ncbi:GAREM1 [Branchiostoma lanceolatum]|uniref:GAREM1 protein n=1 Tax=Branchiostoma lanceolatum TaxID=7740 RepID=A0A8J9ZEU2_BRALA|nr:GAREM1 [Branchiostoma lanceolatum]
MGNVTRCIKKQVEDLKWLEDSLTPEEILEKYNLPTLVKVSQSDRRSQLSKDLVLLVNSFFSEEKVLVQSLERETGKTIGPLVSIPASYAGTFRLLTPQSFQTVQEVVDSQPFSGTFTVEEDMKWKKQRLPDSVQQMMVNELGESGLKGKFPKTLVRRGDLLSMRGILNPTNGEPQGQDSPANGDAGGQQKKTSKKSKKKGKALPAYVICMDQDGEIMCIPSFCSGRFSTIALHNTSGPALTLKDIVEDADIDMPTDVLYVDGEKFMEDEHFTGLIKLLTSYEKKLVVASILEEDGAFSSVEFGVDCGVKFAPADPDDPKNQDFLKRALATPDDEGVRRKRLGSFRPNLGGSSFPSMDSINLIGKWRNRSMRRKGEKSIPEETEPTQEK